jgi:16S rRNA (guanine1516-N2)-methyltransferase
MKIFFQDRPSQSLKKVAQVNSWIEFDSGGLPTEGFFLKYDEEARLGLQDLSEPSWSPLTIDFLEGQWLKRLQKAQHETQLIKRAIGFKPQDNILIWDATAGLGRDAIVLAHLGYKVVAAERSVVLFELLKDAVDRAQKSPELSDTLSRLTLICGDSKALLAGLKVTERPDVIYLDPMYPASKKSAQPKKEMQILRKLIGPDDNLLELFKVAKGVAQKKLILKNNPRTTIDLKPKHSLESKSVRFDVF